MCRELDHRSLGYRFLKRFFDVAFSLCAIIVGFIPGLLLSVAIAIDTKGSPIYSQVRVGKWGKPFRIYKFRTMVADSDNVEKYFTPEQLEVWKRERKVDGDPRIASRIIDATARRSSFGPAVASVFPPKITEISAVFSQVKLSISNLRNLLKNSFQNLFTNYTATRTFFAEHSVTSLFLRGGGSTPLFLWPSNLLGARF